MLGSVTPGPGGDERQRWQWDNEQSDAKDPRRKLPENQRNVGWRSSKLNRFLMYLANDFMPAYLSVTPHVPCFSNKEEEWGKKKQF